MEFVDSSRGTEISSNKQQAVVWGAGADGRQKKMVFIASVTA